MAKPPRRCKQENSISDRASWPQPALRRRSCRIPRMSSWALQTIQCFLSLKAHNPLDRGLCGSTARPTRRCRAAHWPRSTLRQAVARGCGFLHANFLRQRLGLLPDLQCEGLAPQQRLVQARRSAGVLTGMPMGYLQKRDVGLANIR
jgi:hypothetical protein